MDGDHNVQSVCSLHQTLKTEDSKEEDWNGDRQKAEEEEKQRKENQMKRNYYPQNLQYIPPYDFKDRQSHHCKTEEERRERLELLNDYLDYYPDSESEHEYDTLI